VAVGHNPGVYEEWVYAQEQIKGVKGPKYKKFATREEAQEFVRTGGKSSTVLATKNKDVDVEEPLTKKAKMGNESVPSRSAPTSLSKNKTVVYTDGSSLGNGYHGAAAGVGVYFGDGDPR
jgi:ribonuclease HI